MCSCVARMNFQCLNVKTNGGLNTKKLHFASFATAVGSEKCSLPFLVFLPFLNLLPNRNTPFLLLLRTFLASLKGTAIFVVWAIPQQESAT